MTATRIVGLLVLNGVLSVSIAASERSPDLEPYRWRHRVLIVSASSASDPRLAEMRRHLRQQACGVAQRDLVVLEDVGASSFLIRLVGKDGGEKLRRETLVPVEEIFSLIDAMPMREAERRRRPEGC